MRTLIALTMFGILSGAAGLSPAAAQTFWNGPSQEEALKTTIEGMGYRLDALVQHEGHYHARLVDRVSGEAVRAAFAASNGNLLHAELADQEEIDDPEDD